MGLLKFFLVLLVIFTSACSSSESEKKGPLILVSLGPYQEIVQSIAGKTFDVKTIVPPEANPHTYEPTARQSERYKKAAIWFQMREPFEKKLFEVLEAHHSPCKKVDLLKNLPLLHEPHLGCNSCSTDHQDRHVWLSPRLVKEQAVLICETLQTLFPEEKEAFSFRLSLLLDQLDALDATIRKTVSQAPCSTMLVSHPAFGYFCHDYGFEQLSIEYEGKDPRPQHLSQVFEASKEHQVPLAFAIPQHNNLGAQRIAEKLRIPVRWIDPYSTDYFKMMGNLSALLENPECAL